MIKNRISKLVEKNYCNKKNTFNVYNILGMGEYGKVYKACVKNNGSCAAVKESLGNLETEYTISEKLKKYNTPNVYRYIRCKSQQYLFSNYIDGLDLKKYLRTKPAIPDVKNIMKKVLTILDNIHKNDELKSFRHHDLHLSNILITKDKKPLIMDFGLATIDGVNNPNIKGIMFKRDFGIFPGSHPMYDAHMFLNALYTEKSTPLSIKNFILKIFGHDYLGEETAYVKNFRLRSDVTHVLPTYDLILEDDFFKSKKKPANILKGILATKKPNVKTTKPKSVKSDAIKAKQNAMAFLAKTKSPQKQKRPATRRPILRKPSAKPLTVRTSPNKKNNGNK